MKRKSSATDKLKIERISKKKLRLENKLSEVSRFCQLETPIGGFQFHIDGVPAPSEHRYACLKGQHTQVQAHVDYDDYQAELGGRRWLEFDEDYQGLAWCTQHDVFLTVLQSLLEDTFDFAFAASDQGRLIGLQFRIVAELADEDAQQGGTRVMAGRLLLEESTVEQLLHRCTPLSSAGSMSVPFHVNLQGPMLDYEEFRGLRTGDVLVAGHPDQLSALYLRCDHTPYDTRCWSMTPSEHGLMIQHEQPQSTAVQSDNTVETPMEDMLYEDEQPLSDDQVVANDVLADIPVEVQFRVGDVQVPLHDLANLMPGAVFQLPPPEEGDSVEIIACGRAIGSGRLVVAGETLGVRVTAWNRHAIR